MATTSLSFLIEQLRRQLMDDTAPYTYSDSSLSGYLLDSVKALGNRWGNKYMVVNTNEVQRNTSLNVFEYSEPPVIQYQDERAVILQASIMIKGGTKWSESGSAVNWRDDEISYSNIQSAIQRSSTLKDDIDELNSLFKIKLAKARSSTLPGWGKDWS